MSPINHNEITCLGPFEGFKKGTLVTRVWFLNISSCSLCFSFQHWRPRRSGWPFVQRCTDGSCLRGPSSSWHPRRTSCVARPAPYVLFPPGWATGGQVLSGERPTPSSDADDEGVHTASLVCLSFSLSDRTLCCSALSARRFSCGPKHCVCVCVNLTKNTMIPLWLTHDSVYEGDEILFLFLPLDEVSLDQRLQLRQILDLPLPVDVLPSETQSRGVRMRLVCARSGCFSPDWRYLMRLTHIKIYFLPIRELWDGNVGHEPVEVKSLWLCDLPEGLFFCR